MTTLTTPTVGPTSPRLRPKRDRYIDTLRAVAMVRVITYHLMSWAWLPVVFPSMGIMFALAGSLVAASLDRARPWPVILKRLRRLLPSLWAMGLVLVPVMLMLGWTYNPVTYEGSPLDWRLLHWILPLQTPPGSEWAANFVLPFWYVRTYLWLVLLSPVLLWLFRRWPMRTLAAPLLLVTAFTVGLVVNNGSASDEVLISIATFAACWMIGFALHDGSLARVPAPVVIAAGLGLLLVGVLVSFVDPDPAIGWSLDAVPAANAAYSLGAVMIALRFKPSFDWLQRVPVLDKLVTVFNARALTIYLWGNVAITAAIAVENSYIGGQLYPWSDTATARTVQWILTWVFVAVLVAALGWVEDLAAKRPLRINPWPRGKGRLRAATGASPDPARGPRTPGRRSRWKPLHPNPTTAVAPDQRTTTALR